MMHAALLCSMLFSSAICTLSGPQFEDPKPQAKAGSHKRPRIVRGCVGAARMDSWESWTMESWLALINIKLFVRSCATSRISHSVWKNAQKRDPLLGVQKMAPQHNINLISSHAPDFSKPFWTPKVGPVFGFWAFLHPMQISVMQSCNSFNTWRQPLKNNHGLHLALIPSIVQLQLQLRGAFKATPAFCYGSRSQNWDPESLSFCDFWNNAKFTISIKRRILPSLLFNLFILLLGSFKRDLLLHVFLGSKNEPHMWYTEHTPKWSQNLVRIWFVSAAL